MIVRVALLLLAFGGVVGGVACAPAPAFGPREFRSPNGSYEIEYAKPGQQLLIDDKWSVQNYRHSQGVPVEPLTEGDFVSESTWVTEDGSREPIRTPTYELLLEHVSNATIWVRLLPLPRRIHSKQVRFLAENYVNNLTGSFYSDYFDSQPAERRISTKILSSEPLTVLDFEARRVRFEAVNLDQLEHDPDAPRDLVEVIVVKGPFRTEARGEGSMAPFQPYSCSATPTKQQILTSSTETSTAWSKV